MRGWLLVAALALAFVAPAGAQTFLVRPDGTGDFPTIDAAIVAVPEGSTILLADGVFRGEGNRDLDYRGKAITIRSQSGDPARCVIDLEEIEGHRGFRFWAGEDSLSVLEGITVRRGRMDVGAGLYCVNGGSPKIVRCVIEANVATYPDYGGGGIFCTGSPILEDCRLSDNSAPAGGGIAVVMGGAPVLRRVAFEGNSATSGGAVWTNSSTLHAIGCRATANQAANGGAWYLYRSSIDARDCAFEGNAAAGSGGAICAGAPGDYALDGCVFDANVAVDGAAIFTTPAGRYAFAGCTFTSNDASNRGGAIYCGHGASECLITGCTLSANSAAQGAGLYVQTDTYANLVRCIVALAPLGEAITCPEQGIILPRLECCDVFGNAGGDWIGCLGLQDGMRGNISLDPLFCAGPTDDLHLQPESPCAPGECPLIGAWPVGCQPSGTPEPEASLRLAPASPVPFSRSVELDFSAPAGAATGVELTIHDAAGRLVRTLFAGPSPRAAGRVAWDGSDAWGRSLGTGIYFCRLAAGSRTSVARLVLVR